MLRDAVVNLLLPTMEREARATLAVDARTAVLEAAADQLWGYASQPPLQVGTACRRAVTPREHAGECLGDLCAPFLVRRPPSSRCAWNWAPRSPSASRPGTRATTSNILSAQVRLVDEEDTETERRVMAACYGPGNPATTFVMLDPSGNLVDFLHCPQFR